MRQRFEDQNDDCLIPHLKEGDMDAFAVIYERYYGALYHNIYRLTKDSTVSEDLLQDTFIRFWQQRTQLLPGKSISGWLFMISYHIGVNWLKHQLVEVKAKAALTLQTADNDLPSYEHLMQMLEQALLKLSPQKRKVIELCKLNGHTYQQAARAMNISSHTVKEYLSDGMKAIRDFALSHPEFKALVPLFWIISKNA